MEVRKDSREASPLEQQEDCEERKHPISHVGYTIRVLFVAMPVVFKEFKAASVVREIKL